MPATSRSRFGPLKFGEILNFTCLPSYRILTCVNDGSGRGDKVLIVRRFHMLNRFTPQFQNVYLCGGIMEGGKGRILKKVSKAGIANSAYGAWDRVKVSKNLFDLLFTHPVFQREPKAINTAQYWLNEIDAATARNEGRPVTWDYKDIQDRFRKFAQSPTVFRDALRDLGLVNFTTYKPPPNALVQGTCRAFTITRLGQNLISEGNQQWLYSLLKDPQTHRRNQVAVSKRKKSRMVYSDPMKRIIDEFRHAVEFERDSLLHFLNTEKVKNPTRCRAAYHDLLALVTKKFRELEVKEGRICYEFVTLPAEYRPFALVKGKLYVATLDIRACWPTFLGKLLGEFYATSLKERLLETPDPLLLEVAAKLERDVDPEKLKVECQTWTFIFTNSEDPRVWISRKSGIDAPKADMKNCLNRWLNGGRQYEREADGKRNRKHHQQLEAWFQRRFPEMAKVWGGMKDRSMTGNLIAKAYELPLLLNPALYDLGKELGLVLSYEYDGVGVFADQDDPDLPSKLEKVGQYIQRQSVEEFGVPVVVKTEYVAA